MTDTPRPEQPDACGAKEAPSRPANRPDPSGTSAGGKQGARRGVYAGAGAPETLSPDGESIRARRRPRDEWPLRRRA